MYMLIVSFYLNFDLTNVIEVTMNIFYNIYNFLAHGNSFIKMIIYF